MGNEHQFAVIVAGGRGERFWPKSRAHKPKQLLPLISRKTMIEETFARLKGLVQARNVFIITNREQAPAIRKLFPKLPRENIVAEPVGRDTAAAVGLGAALVSKRDAQGIMILMWADAAVDDVSKVQKILKGSQELAAKEDCLIVLGARPDHPNTGYGYLEMGRQISGPFYQNVAFKEKPDLQTAEKYVAAGNYRWNSGMIVVAATPLLNLYRQFTPPLNSFLEKIMRVKSLNGLNVLLAREYPKLEKVSVDYAIFEKAPKVVVADCDFHWDDLGTWTSLAKYVPRDEQGNAQQGHVVALRTSNTLVFGGAKLIATLGVSDLIVVQTEDATLVAHRSEAQKIKELVHKISLLKGGKKYL